MMYSIATMMLFLSSTVFGCKNEDFLAGGSSVSAKMQNPPTFNTLWQAVKSAGYPRKVTHLYRGEESQLAFSKKHQLEAGFENPEQYLRKEYLNGVEPQLIQSAFPYKIKQVDGESISQLVLWLPEWEWSNIVERVAPTESELLHVRIKENSYPILRELVEKLHERRVADEDILMYVFYKNKEALPNLPNVQVCIRSRRPEALSVRAPDLSSTRISDQDGYSWFTKTLLAKHPLEYKMVENFTHKANGRKLHVPLIPAAALESANHVAPCHNDKVRRFFERHSVDFDKLQYGKDFVYALHGTKLSITKEDKTVIPVWDLIRQRGLKETPEYGACGRGIYCARSAGLCSNSSRGNPKYPNGNPEFTTIQYGSDFKKKDITRIVVVLVMNPQAYRAVEKVSQIECADWILPRSEDTLILDMLEMDTKHISELVLKFDDSELARDTGVKKAICPDNIHKKRNACLASIRTGLSGISLTTRLRNIKCAKRGRKTRRKRRKKSALVLSIQESGKMSGDLTSSK